MTQRERGNRPVRYVTSTRQMSSASAAGYVTSRRHSGCARPPIRAERSLHTGTRSSSSSTDHLSSSESTSLLSTGLPDILAYLPAYLTRTPDASAPGVE
jgi:hypothetical protein